MDFDDQVAILRGDRKVSTFTKIRDPTFLKPQTLPLCVVCSAFICPINEVCTY